MKSDQKFPLEGSKSACVFKWGWNTLRLWNGHSSSCHRVTSVKVPIDSFDNFHNTPEVIEDRKKMFAGEWPYERGCLYCKQLEDAGGMSDRTYHNQLPDITPVDFNAEERTLSVTPSIQEVYLSNTCDLACTYCFPQFSIKYNQELKQFGPNTIGFKYLPKDPQHSEYYQAFMQWLEKNIHKLKRLNIMGGEPFIQKEFWSVMDFLKSKKLPDLILSVHTNLNSKKEIYEQYIETIKQMLKEKKLKRADVNCSLDCWGPQAEFVRFGLDLDRWKENFEYMISHKWLKISVQHAVTSLTLSTTQELQDRIGEYKKKVNSKIYQAYQLVDNQPSLVYEPTIFGNEMFTDKLKKLVSTYPITEHNDTLFRKRLEGILKKQMMSIPSRERLIALHRTLDELDLRRKTDWRSLFPEIHNYFDTHNIKWCDFKKTFREK